MLLVPDGGTIKIVSVPAGRGVDIWRGLLADRIGRAQARRWVIVIARGRGHVVSATEAVARACADGNTV